MALNAHLERYHKTISHEVELLDRLSARMPTPTELMFVKQMDFALGKISYETLINE